MFGFDKKVIIKPWMLVIMTARCKEHRCDIQIIKFWLLLEPPLENVRVNCVADISTMSLIMISYFFIPCWYFSYEAYKAINWDIKLWEILVFVEEIRSNCYQLIFSSQFFYFKYIELLSVYQIHVRLGQWWKLYQLIKRQVSCLFVKDRITNQSRWSSTYTFLILTWWEIVVPRNYILINEWVSLWFSF